MREPAPVHWIFSPPACADSCGDPVKCCQGRPWQTLKPTEGARLHLQTCKNPDQHLHQWGGGATAFPDCLAPFCSLKTIWERFLLNWPMCGDLSRVSPRLSAPTLLLSAGTVSWHARLKRPSASCSAWGFSSLEIRASFSATTKTWHRLRGSVQEQRCQDVALSSK